MGDAEIWSCANRSAQPGNLGTWVKVDQNHHVERTVEQIRQAVEALARGAVEGQLLAVLQDP